MIRKVECQGKILSDTLNHSKISSEWKCYRIVWFPDFLGMKKSRRTKEIIFSEIRFATLSKKTVKPWQNCFESCASQKYVVHPNGRDFWWFGEDFFVASKSVQIPGYIDRADTLVCLLNHFVGLLFWGHLLAVKLKVGKLPMLSEAK